MTEINLPLLEERAREIRANVGKIRQYATLSDDVFLADERNLYTIMHLLLISVEATAAICNHLTAKLARKAPDSYAECFQTLVELDIISVDLASHLVPMARFRNLLVHRYQVIDPERVLKIACTDVANFETFLEQVWVWLKNRVQQ